MAIAPAIDARSTTATRFEYAVVRVKDAKSLTQDDDTLVPARLNELGEQGWKAVGISLKYGDLMAWPVVLLKRPLR
jgi:hypothetical protein